MAILVIEEKIVSALKAYITSAMPAVLAELNLTLGATEQMVMPKDIFDDYVDPSMMPRFPAMSLFVDETEDEIKDRALRVNVCTTRALFAYVAGGPNQLTGKIGYRYAALLTNIVISDPTFGMQVGRANVTKRVYYAPTTNGERLVRCAEVYLEILQEVRRS